VPELRTFGQDGHETSGVSEAASNGPVSSFSSLTFAKVSRHDALASVCIGIAVDVFARPTPGAENSMGVKTTMSGMWSARRTGKSGPGRHSEKSRAKPPDSQSSQANSVLRTVDAIPLLQYPAHT